MHTSTRSLRMLFGVSLPQLLGKTDYDWLPREVAAELRENDSLVLWYVANR